MYEYDKPCDFKYSGSFSDTEIYKYLYKCGVDTIHLNEITYTEFIFCMVIIKSSKLCNIEIVSDVPPNYILGYTDNKLKLQIINFK